MAECPLCKNVLLQSRHVILVWLTAALTLEIYTASRRETTYLVLLCVAFTVYILAGASQGNILRTSSPKDQAVPYILLIEFIPTPNPSSIPFRD